MLTVMNLIGNGYLPYELVPAISTKKLEEALPKFMSKLQGVGERSSKYCTYTIPKVKHVRRTLAIPNPLHQIKLSNVIVEKWSEIDLYISQSPISMSKPEISYLMLHNDSERTFSRKINLSEIPIQRAKLSTDSRYLLKADISRFYPTIYTHIIPWALHSKGVAKKNAASRKRLFGDMIDAFVRSTQDNQTIGIPIGPDTSFIISEIVGTAIDLELQRKLKVKKIKLKGFRFVDDFYLYFNNHADAYYALSVLHEIMKEFELELNTEKTKIIELPTVLEAEWVLELRQVQYQVQSKGWFRNDELITYFSRAFELSKIFPDDSVLKYALTEIADIWIDKEYWCLYESLLLKATIAEPSVLPTVIEIFLAYKNMKYPLDNKKIKESMSELIVHHCQYNHTHEITWALWMFKTMKIKVPSKVANILSKKEDSLVALVALDLYNGGLIKNLDVTNWRKYLSAEQLYSSHWLLAYEARKKGWITVDTDNNYLEDDSFFKLLLENDVEFYDQNQQVTPVLVKNPVDLGGVFQSQNRRRRKMRFY